MADPVNTVSSFTYRNKYMMSTLQQVLRNAVVAEKICRVDRTDLYTIQNPYSSQPTASSTGLTGTFSVSNWTTTNDALTVDTQVAIAEHVYSHQQTLTNFDMFADRADNQAYAFAYKIDYEVLNKLCEDGTGTYTTPSGGFTTASNIIPIMANLLSKCAGYQGVGTGYFLVIENTDIVGFAQAGATSGYSMADSVLRNGFMDSFMGVDIYVVRTGTFANATLGNGDAVTNSGHRVFGIKGLATYATPRGMTYEEVSVAESSTGNTGKQLRTYGNIGFKVWTQIASLIIDITIS
jgi:hypothetical protein